MSDNHFLEEGHWSAGYTLYIALSRHSFHKYRITIGQYCLSLCGSAIPSFVRSPMIGSGKKSLQSFQNAIMLIAPKTLRNIEHPRAESSSTLRNSHLVSWKWRDLPWIGYLKILLAWRTLLVCNCKECSLDCLHWSRRMCIPEFEMLLTYSTLFCYLYGLGWVGDRLGGSIWVD